MPEESAEPGPAPITRLRHDLANPLGALLAELEWLKTLDGIPPEATDSIAAIERQAMRMRDLLRERR